MLSHPLLQFRRGQLSRLHWHRGLGSSAPQANGRRRRRAYRQLQRLLVGQRSRCLHVDRQPETGRPDLILKSEPHKLGFALLQGLGEAGGSLRTDASATLLDVAEMGSRNPEKLRKGREAHLIGFSNTREGSPKRQRPPHQRLQVLRRLPTRRLLRPLSSHVCSPLRRRPSGRSRRRAPDRWLDTPHSAESLDTPASRPSSRGRGNQELIARPRAPRLLQVDPESKLLHDVRGDFPELLLGSRR